MFMWMKKYQAKETKLLSDKLSLNAILGALDNKDMDFYDRITPAQQKQLSPFLLNRYMSIVKGSNDLASYYLLATNQNVNVMYFALAKHPKLIWQLLCTVSPGMGKHFHQWVGFKKKNANKNNNTKLLAKLYPLRKKDEIECLASITTKQEIKKLLEEHGVTEKDTL